MNVQFNPPRLGVDIGEPARLGVSLGDPVSRYVVEPYVAVEETEDGAVITCTSQGETTTGEIYNGISPDVAVTAITGGHEVSITDKDGTQTFDVMDGVDGKDGSDGKDGKDGATGRTPEIFTTAVGLAAGATPYANTSGTIEQPLITFGIPAGQNGTNGTDGTDGVSPDVTIASITGGHSVTITDADHPSGQTFNVMDGAQGNPTTVNGKTGASITLTASDVGALPDTYTAPVTSVNSKTGAVSLSASDVGALPDDTVVSKVEQTETTTSGYSNWRSVLVSYGSNGTWNGSIATQTNLVRHFQNLRYQPSTGTLRTSIFYGNLTGNVTGTASGNLKSGDNVSTLTNDAGYLTLADLPIWDGGVT